MCQAQNCNQARSDAEGIHLITVKIQDESTRLQYYMRVYEFGLFCNSRRATTRLAGQAAFSDMRLMHGPQLIRLDAINLPERLAKEKKIR